jgi:hypothetical protein
MTDIDIITPLSYPLNGSGVGISTIKKFTSDRGWGMTPQSLSYKAFNLSSHSDHKYTWLRGGDKTRPNDFDLQLGCCISDALSIFIKILYKSVS